MTLALPALVPALPTHERWFVESQAAGDWSFFFSPLPLVLTTAVVAVTLLWRAVAMRFDGPELPFLRRLGGLVPWIPRLLGIHLGVALLALAATGAFITPSNDPSGRRRRRAAARRGGARDLAGHRRQPPPAAGFVLALAPALALVAGWTALGESANLAAVAAFLSSYPPGPTPTAPPTPRVPSCDGRSCCSASAWAPP